jgi:hypothetical protein
VFYIVSGKKRLVISCVHSVCEFYPSSDIRTLILTHYGGLSPSSSIFPSISLNCDYILIYHLGEENSTTGGRSWEIKSHTTNDSNTLCYDGLLKCFGTIHGAENSLFQLQSGPNSAWFERSDWQYFNNYKDNRTIIKHKYRKDNKYTATTVYMTLYAFHPLYMTRLDGDKRSFTSILFWFPIKCPEYLHISSDKIINILTLQCSINPSSRLSNCVLTPENLSQMWQPTYAFTTCRLLEKLSLLCHFLDYFCAVWTTLPSNTIPPLLQLFLDKYNHIWVLSLFY